MLPTPRQLNDNDENEELEAIRDLQREVSGAQRSISIDSSMANAANIHLLAGEGDPFDDSGDNPFTGTAILYPAFTDANGDWHIIGMNAGTLQFGLSATDGKAYAGAGAVVLSDSGLSFFQTDSYDDKSSVKYYDINDNELCSEIYGTITPSSNNLSIYLNAIDGKSSKLGLFSNSPTSKASTATIQAVSGITNARIFINSIDTSTSYIILNASEEDVDTYIEGTTTRVIEVNAGTNALLINGATTINSTSADVDTIINGDTAAVITVDASADGATVNNLTVTGTAGNVLSGTYTPTLSNTTNIAVSAAYVCQYMRVGSVVTVSGRVDIDATAAGAILLGMTLPIASNFANSNECGGAAAASVIHQSLGILADTTNNRASFSGTVTDTAGRAYHFSFTYLII